MDIYLIRWFTICLILLSRSEFATCNRKGSSHNSRKSPGINGSANYHNVNNNNNSMGGGKSWPTGRYPRVPFPRLRPPDPPPFRLRRRPRYDASQRFIPIRHSQPHSPNVVTLSQPSPPAPMPQANRVQLIPLDIQLMQNTFGYFVMRRGNKYIYKCKENYLFQVITNGQELLWAPKGHSFPNVAIYKEVRGEYKLKVYFPTQIEPQSQSESDWIPIPRQVTTPYDSRFRNTDDSSSQSDSMEFDGVVPGKSGAGFIPRDHIPPQDVRFMPRAPIPPQDVGFIPRDPSPPQDVSFMPGAPTPPQEVRLTPSDIPPKPKPKLAVQSSDDEVGFKVTDTTDRREPASTHTSSIPTHVLNSPKPTSILVNSPQQGHHSRPKPRVSAAENTAKPAVHADPTDTVKLKYNIELEIPPSQIDVVDGIQQSGQVRITKNLPPGPLPAYPDLSAGPPTHKLLTSDYPKIAKAPVSDEDLLSTVTPSSFPTGWHFGESHDTAADVPAPKRVRFAEPLPTYHTPLDPSKTMPYSETESDSDFEVEERSAPSPVKISDPELELRPDQTKDQPEPAVDAKPESEPEPKPESQPEPEPKPESEPVSEPKADAEPVPEPKADEASVSEPKVDPAVEPVSQPDPTSYIPYSESDSEIDMDGHSQLVPLSKPRESDGESVVSIPLSDSDSDSEIELDPRLKPAAQPPAAPETQPAPDSAAQPQPVVEPASQTTPQSVSQPEPVSAPQPAPQTISENQNDPLPKKIPRPQLNPKSIFSESESEIDLESEPETKPLSATESGPRAASYTVDDGVEVSSPPFTIKDVPPPDDDTNVPTYTGTPNPYASRRRKRNLADAASAAQGAVPPSAFNAPPPGSFNAAPPPSPEAADYDYGHDDAYVHRAGPRKKNEVFLNHDTGNGVFSINLDPKNAEKVVLTVATNSKVYVLDGKQHSMSVNESGPSPPLSSSPDITPSWPLPFQLPFPGFPHNRFNPPGFQGPRVAPPSFPRQNIPTFSGSQSPIVTSEVIPTYGSEGSVTISDTTDSTTKVDTRYFVPSPVRPPTSDISESEPESESEEVRLPESQPVFTQPEPQPVPVPNIVPPSGFAQDLSSASSSSVEIPLSSEVEDLTAPAPIPVTPEVINVPDQTPPIVAPQATIPAAPQPASGQFTVSVVDHIQPSPPVSSPLSEASSTSTPQTSYPPMFGGTPTAGSSSGPTISTPIVLPKAQPKNSH